jgi:hypothetical protein
VFSLCNSHIDDGLLEKRRRADLWLDTKVSEEQIAAISISIWRRRTKYIPHKAANELEVLGDFYAFLQEKISYGTLYICLSLSYVFYNIVGPLYCNNNKSALLQQWLDPIVATMTLDSNLPVIPLLHLSLPWLPSKHDRLDVA